MAKQTGLGLGRGLGALIDTEHISTGGSSSISEVELTLIAPNPNQPRTFFDEEALVELSASIRELGVISPITLRKNEDGTYSIKNFGENPVFQVLRQLGVELSTLKSSERRNAYLIGYAVTNKGVEIEEEAVVA